ncbi:MAG: hypothetical protein HZA95_00375 [Candidatus Vogelbacteria bacterium]|nr:hypothetical protein [Candidatus Vogelbacteria bacterium]
MNKHDATTILRVPDKSGLSKIKQLSIQRLWRSVAPNDRSKDSKNSNQKRSNFGRFWFGADRRSKFTVGPFTETVFTSLLSSIRIED